MNSAIKKALAAGQQTKGSIQTGQANLTTGNVCSKNDKFNPSTINRNFTNTIANIPKREWLVDHLCLKKYITGLVAPGGVGKSSLALALGISVASNNDILQLGVRQQANVLILNNEDSTDELQRRIAGIVTQSQICPSSIEDRLFYTSGYEGKFILSDMSTSGQKETAFAGDLIKYMLEKEIGLLIVDPFVSTHNAPENDNTAMDQVMSIYRKIAAKTGAAITLIHHTRKQQDTKGSSAGNANIARGASALKDAVRVVATLTPMSKDEAQKLTFDDQKRSRHFRLDLAKQNFSPACVNETWFRMESCLIDNGEHVGVPVPVNLKPLFSNSVSKAKWSDLSVAEALERIFGNAASRDWKSLQPQFETDNQVGKSSAYDAIKLLSDDPNKPTVIDNGNEEISYWRSKPPGGHIKINRKVV
jgi:RecA-family ATPase